MGIDVGSVSTKLVLMDKNGKLLAKTYIQTAGRPIDALRESMRLLKRETCGCQTIVSGVGATGSGRKLAGALTGADLIKNEITAHAVAAGELIPGVSTVIEIGGQDSKLILLKNKVAYDFAMNTVCAAGTGSFLDRQAERLGVPIEEFGELALCAKSPVRIAGRCAVFAESDMIHKQQSGHSVKDIVAGLCEALVRNYLNNLAKGKKLDDKVAFQGGVAANRGMVNAFSQALEKNIIVPEYYDVMGAYGAALLSREHMKKKRGTSAFKGFNALEGRFYTDSFECGGCPNMCEIVRVIKDGRQIACWGGRCGRWSEAGGSAV